MEEGCIVNVHYVWKESTYRRNYPYVKKINKPIVVYQFINPFCHRCWEIESTVKKLLLHFGNLITVRPIIFLPHTSSIKRSCSNNRLFSRWDLYQLSIGIKAACLQGNRIGKQFLRFIQDMIFLYEKIESVENMLQRAARWVCLDIDEFCYDYYSHRTLNALESDLQLTKEMGVTIFPSLVFFNQYDDEDIIKVANIQSYDTYKQVLYHMLHDQYDYVLHNDTPKIEDYFMRFPRAETREIAYAFDLSIKDAEKQLIQLLLKRKVAKKEVNGKVVWEYRVTQATYK